MINRRRALSILGIAGIGTTAFQRALAAKVGDGPVSPEMVAEAEWVAGIELTPAQREAAANRLNIVRDSSKRVRAIPLDNSLQPGLVFTPLASPNSRPDPRGYEGTALQQKVASDEIPRRDSDEDIAFASIRHLAALLRSRKISSVELTKLYLERLHRYDPLLKCVVTFMDDVALKQAERADQEFAEKRDRGLLHGIPWGLKDLFAYPGYPTTWGAPQYRDRILDVKAAIAERLDEAGAVLVAKLATNHFAGGGVNWYRGITRNPWNPHKDSSGSSSGSASAAVAGLVGFTIATETSGSIIHPSMRCGAVGLRPTHGRVSRYGCMQLCWSLDKVGTICRSADDCGLVLAAIHGADPRDPASVDRPYVWPSSREISSIRVGYAAKVGDDKAQQASFRVMRELGVKLVPVKLPTLVEEYGLTFELIEGIVTIESAATFEDLTRRGEPKGVKGWPPYWIHGHFLSGVDYLKLNRLRAILMQRIDQMMQTIDVFVGDELSLYTNLTGHPKVVFPTEFTEKEGYPVPRPQMMTGRIYDESTLLALAHACERAINLTNRPSLDQFLEKKDEILAGEEYPDEDKYYTE